MLVVAKPYLKVTERPLEVCYGTRTPLLFFLEEGWQRKVNWRGSTKSNVGKR